MKRAVLFLCFNLLIRLICFAQSPQWSKTPNRFFDLNENQVVLTTLPVLSQEVVIGKAALTPADSTAAIKVRSFSFSKDESKFLIYTNTKKVWRYDTRGDYWVYDLATKKMRRLGLSLPSSSLMFAKFSPDGDNVAYVSGHNIYVEDVASGKMTQLTKDGTRKLINGTFDWAYEEEFDCRDGFRWSPDSKQIAFWQIDAKNTKDYLMLNTTDSIYSQAIPIEYPVAGELPSPFKIGVVSISDGQTKWMNIPTDPTYGSYLPRMEWAANNKELIVQHLNRRQNESDLLLCDASSGESKTILHESDSAWIDIMPAWDDSYKNGGWDWLKNGTAFLWASERDGWRHLYAVSRDGKTQTLITRGNYDVMEIVGVDEASGNVYFLASPDNATQSYLYKARLDGKTAAQRVTPATEPGSHSYEMSPDGKYATHTFSNHAVQWVDEWVTLPAHTAIGESAVANAIASAPKSDGTFRFFKVKTSDGVEMDGWEQRPANFDSTKKYPVVFYVYTEPAAANVVDRFRVGRNFLYRGDMKADGYVYISMDNRGTPAPKGRAWRKSIYRNIGIVNIHDQAMAAKEVLKWSYLDNDRTAVWGWSGGGSATLNLMFQYPDIYKTGIAIAAVGNMLTYDNIYQERYMGVPQESRADYVKGSPITYAKNLKGNLLYIHGTGDDNVHYSNAEMLVNELVKYNKQFQYMTYPNRTHSISEGAGTQQHLSTLYTNYLEDALRTGSKIESIWLLTHKRFRRLHSAFLSVPAVASGSLCRCSPHLSPPSITGSTCLPTCCGWVPGLRLLPFR